MSIYSVLESRCHRVAQRYSSCCSADFLGRLPKVPLAARLSRLTQHKTQAASDGTTRALGERKAGRTSGLDLHIHIEKIGDLAVIECDGRVVRSEAAFKLREVVTSLRNARIIVLDLSEVPAIEGAGLGMLLFLQGWAHRHNIQFKLFNPARSVRDGLELVNSITELDITTLHEMMELLANADCRYALAA
jgi:anti-anti-sigma regulatory factor